MVQLLRLARPYASTHHALEICRRKAYGKDFSCNRIKSMQTSTGMHRRKTRLRSAIPPTHHECRHFLEQASGTVLVYGLIITPVC